jgi:SSS family solute:Na+ symporter
MVAMLFAKISMLLCFFSLIVGLSLYSRRKTNTVNDFVVGNRTIGPWMSAFSYGTAYFSAVLLIGFAGKVGWGYGMSALLIALGNSIIGTYLAWRILGRKTREMTSRLNVLTMPSFLEKRYDSPKMKVFSSLIIFIFFVPYAASVFMGLSYLFEQIFGIPYVLALAVMAVLSGLYLVLGGYMAVALVDFVQGLIMIAGVVLMVYFVLGHEMVNGFVNGFTALRAQDPGLILPTSPVTWIGLLSLIILTSLGTWGLPQMVGKFYGIKNEQSIPVATWVSSIFSLIITMGAYYVGSTGHLFFAELPVFNGVSTPDLIMPIIIGQTLPPLVGVLILILVLSASMSTLSSLVLTASSSVSIDLIKGAFYITILLLIALGSYIISTGDLGMGVGLIAGALGVFALKFIQNRKISQMAQKGLVAHDERSLYLSSKAALAAVRVYILILALLVLAGSVLDPLWPLTPWDLIGILLALMVFLWIGFYYNYNRVE